MNVSTSAPSYQITTRARALEVLAKELRACALGEMGGAVLRRMNKSTRPLGGKLVSVHIELVSMLKSDPDGHASGTAQHRILGIQMSRILCPVYS